MSKFQTLVIAVVFTCARGHVAWNTQNQLHPVQSLYVKPSVDGATGDLYVAATEDSGVKTQWLTDQPINFLPAAAQQAMPVSYASSLTALPHDEATITTQKRAIITSPTVKYAYALPGASSDGNVVPYPYTVPVSTPTVSAAEGSPECTEAAAPAITSYPQYTPYQYYYPHMMSAFVNAVNALTEAGVNENTANSVMSKAAPTMWPYAYPVQYVMVDPATWAQSQSTTTLSLPTTSSTNSEAASNESA